MEQSPLSRFCFFQLGLCSVSYTANEYSIYHFCIMIKDFHFFSRVIVVQDFEIVTFYVLYVYKPTFSVIFCVSKLFENVEWSNSLLRHFKIQTLLKINCCMVAISTFRVTQHSQFFHFSLQIEFNALRFINYTIRRLCSTYVVATLALRCLKYIKGIFSPHAVWHSCFLIPPQSFYRKRAKSLGKILFQL